MRSSELVEDYSHFTLRARRAKGSKLLLDILGVLNESWVLSELSLTDWVEFEQRVVTEAVYYVEHDAVSDRNSFACSKPRVISLKLSVQISEESSPCLVKGGLCFEKLHVDTIIPSVEDPVDFCSLLPVLRIVVAIFNAKRAEDGHCLGHFFPIPVNDGKEKPKLIVWLSRYLLPDPSGHRHSRIGPSLASVEEHGTNRLRTPMSFEILNLNTVRNYAVSRGTASHS